MCAGVALFQLLGGSGTDPLQTAFTFSAIMYATKYLSGGHLNPAVSLAALLSGHIDYIRGFMYIGAQVREAHCHGHSAGLARARDRALLASVPPPPPRKATSVARCILSCVALRRVQFLGAIAGALIQAFINPDSDFGHTGPGCYEPDKLMGNW